MNLTEKNKNIIKGFVGFMLFLLLYFFSGVPFELLNVNIEETPLILIHIYSILTELIVITIIIIMFKDYMIKSIKDFIKNKDKYFKKYIKYWFIILISTFILNGIIMLLNNGNIAGNEEQIRNQLGTSTLYMWISGVLLAPLLEELVFRLSIKSMIKNKWIFIILSGLIFGSFHLLGNVNTLLDLLYIFPYSIPGCIFAYILYESDNIFNTIGIHFLHNGILMSLEIFILIFGGNII